MDIAVVDDEKAIREHICGMVKEQQPESRIEAYATGEELLASGKRFDIVFLDIQMEGMNGIEAARGLRKGGGISCWCSLRALRIMCLTRLTFMRSSIG